MMHVVTPGTPGADKRLAAEVSRDRDMPGRPAFKEVIFMSDCTNGLHT